MAQSRNLFLAALSKADAAVLHAHIKPIELVQGAVLFEMGGAIDQMYFPHSGAVSLVVDLTSGETIESAMIGMESIVGASSGLNSQISVCKAIVQIAGEALSPIPACSCLGSKQRRVPRPAFPT
jgi:CRP-like cAMP-binding protein